MSSPFGPLDIGLSGMQAQQGALNVVGQNMANANTTGYSRQVAAIEALAPTGGLANQNGAVLAQVQRVHSSLLSQQQRQSQGNLSAWTEIQNQLNQIQAVFNEPSSTGLQGSMDQFFSAWQAVANDPSNVAVRQSLVGQAQNLTTTLHTLFGNIVQMQNSLNQKIQLDVQEVNHYAQQVAQMNQQILTAQGSGQNSNNLQDQRDQTLANLGKLVNFSVQNLGNGTDRVIIGNIPLVDGTQVNSLTSSTTIVASNQTVSMTTISFGGTTLSPQTPVSVETQTNQSLVGWSLGGGKAIITGGSLGADLAMVDSGQGGLNLPYTIPQILGDLNSFATSLVYSIQGYSTSASATATVSGTTFSSLYGSGYPLSQTGSSTTIPYDVFTPSLSATTIPANLAESITVQPILVQNPQFLRAASQPNQPGDGQIAQQISNLATTAIASPPNGSLTQMYGAMVGKLGDAGQLANTQVSQGQLVATTIDNQMQALEGVSLNQEATSMIQYQRAYQASAELITTANQMLGSLLGMLQ